MWEQIRVLNRMCDVGLALYGANLHKRSLNRIQLQKFIYLLDVVGYLYDIFPPLEGHKTYKNGPYDLAIQNAVDTMAFRELVKVNSLSLSNGNITSDYELTDAGLSWVRKLLSDKGIAIRQEVAREVTAKVNSLGWYRLVDLVYAEPTFATARPHGYGRLLTPNNGLENTAALLIQTLRYSLYLGDINVQPDRNLLIDLFFRYLDSCSKLTISTESTL
jgi:hypothetical protein